MASYGKSRAERDLDRAEQKLQRGMERDRRAASRGGSSKRKRGSSSRKRDASPVAKRGSSSRKRDASPVSKRGSSSRKRKRTGTRRSSGLASRTPAQRAAFQRMIAARRGGGRDASTSVPSKAGPTSSSSRSHDGRRSSSRGRGRSSGSSRRSGSAKRRVGRDDDKANRGNPDRQRINAREPYEVAYWAKEYGVSRQRLVDAVRRAGRGATAEQVRAMLGGSSRGTRDPGTSRPKRATSRSRGGTGARGGSPAARRDFGRGGRGGSSRSSRDARSSGRGSGRSGGATGRSRTVRRPRSGSDYAAVMRDLGF